MMRAAGGASVVIYMFCTVAPWGVAREAGRAKGVGVPVAEVEGKPMIYVGYGSNQNIVPFMT